MKKIWDISPPVSPASPVFEGDTAYGQRWSWQIDKGSPVNVAAIALSGHVGAHAALDALPERVLIRTYRTFPHAAFDPQLRALDAQVIEQLADRGVQLIGIDSASVDPASSKDLPSHQALRRRDMRVLENLCLDDVPEGDYELIALPLRWIQADASPVRAILRPL
jgi:arylformamidase